MINKGAVKLNGNQIERLKDIVIYKGLGYFKDEEQLVKSIEKMGYVTLDTNRKYAQPTQKGIDYLIEKGLLKDEKGELDKMEKYYDKNGVEIKAGMTLQHDDGETELVYETDNNDLGFNASNENHKGYVGVYRELYPLYQFNMNEWKVIKS